MNWQPMADRVLVERLKPKQSLIILTDAEKHRKYKVLAIGPKVTDVQRGDIVVLPGIASNEPDHEDGETILIQEADIGWKESN